VFGTPLPDRCRPAARRRQPAHRLVGGDGRQHAARGRVGPGAVRAPARRPPALDRVDDATVDEGVPEAARDVPGTTVARTHGTIDDNPHLNEEWKAAGRPVRGDQARPAGAQRRAARRRRRAPCGRTRRWRRAGSRRSRAISLSSSPRSTRRRRRRRPRMTRGSSSRRSARTVRATCSRTGRAISRRTAGGTAVVFTHHEFEGDRVVGEVNNGGEMVEHVIRTQDDLVPFKAVRASRGKQTGRSRSPRCSGRRRRAEPSSVSRSVGRGCIWSGRTRSWRISCARGCRRTRIQPGPAGRAGVGGHGPDAR
jgi:hypothetical protein